MIRSAFHYSLSEVAKYIDWSYFFHAWGMGAEKHAAKAEELKRDAESILAALEGKYRTHALFALCDAKGEEENIIIEGTRLPLLRQQHKLQGKPNLCLSDFVSPHGDKVGLFATTVDAGFGTEYRNDDYTSITVQALADRLAEATATLLHLNVRREDSLWGYAPDEQLTVGQLNREEHQGIRPAVGYPSLPDQSVIFIIDRMLRMKEIGIEITENGAMFPHASVCGIMLSHPAARYFAVGSISREQFEDYSSRRGLPAEEIKKFLAGNLKE